ncbi:MAG TPA: argininosuccinate lyase [Thermoanaerobaculia bacterium]|nr:argininosuccinate lyase [Thermoanaerobaculia bacterium]
MTRLWDKGEPLDERVLRYTAGEDHKLDARLVAYEVRASIAHAEMLGAQGLLAAADLEAVRTGLQELGAAHAAGEWQIELAEEDAQTALEERLAGKIGEAARRVHLGRSRNDQVLTSLRLYLRDVVEWLAAGAESVATALDALATREADTPLPGYTHSQPAMPSSVPLWTGGWATALRDDAAGIAAVRRRLELCPLGSAAGYGVPLLPIDREATARALGFAGPQEPVTAVQISRGKAEAQLLFELTLLMNDLGRLAADIILFNMAELGYVELAPELTTGSSIMPQKKNPDVFELVRGRSAAAQACLYEALAIVAKLSSGYHRDLQLLKAPLFRGTDLAEETCAVMAHALDGVHFRRDRIRLDRSLTATEEAYRLVIDEGIPFREAYRRTAAKYL